MRIDDATAAQNSSVAAAGLSARTCATVNEQIASISDDLPIPGEACVAKIGLARLSVH
jgi:hypothetical protein